jgi:hypothetical protein
LKETADPRRDKSKSKRREKVGDLEITAGDRIWKNTEGVLDMRGFRLVDVVFCLLKVPLVWKRG